MSGARFVLSAEDRESLGDWWDSGTEPDLTWDLSTLYPHVEAIVTRAVCEALTNAADEISAEAERIDGGEDWPDAMSDAFSADGLRQAARIVRARTTHG